MTSQLTGGKTFSEAVEISATVIFVLLLLRVVEQFTGYPLSNFGIFPRTPVGLAGILTSPLLHADWTHLITNSTPLFVLVTLLYWDKHNHPEQTLGMIWFISGLGTWVIGRPAIHIGASSIIFGLISYFIMAGIWSGRWRSLFVGLLVFFIFGGVLYGVLPQQGHISWEGHLSGAFAGIWAAKRNFLN